MKKFIRILFKTILTLILLAILLVVGVRLYAVLSIRDNIVKPEELSEGEWKFSKESPADAVIVLGAGVYRDGSLSPVLRHRLETTVDVYESGAARVVFVTGDHREGEYDEVDHMIDFLADSGIPRDAIQYDYQGFSTYESMKRAAEVYGIRTAVVVTQGFHLPRAMMIGRFYGLDLLGAEASEAGSRTGQMYRELREWPACVKDLALSLTKAEYTKFR